MKSMAETFALFSNPNFVKNLAIIHMLQHPVFALMAPLCRSEYQMLDASLI